MEGVAGDEGSFELGGGVLVEEALGDGEFAVVLFAALGALGEGMAGSVEAEGDDAAEPPLAPRSLPSSARDLGRRSLFSVSQALRARASSTGSMRLTRSLRAP